MNDEIVDTLDTQKFTLGSAILEVMYYYPSGLKFQHLPIIEAVENTQRIRMKKGKMIDTLTFVDVEEIVVKMGELKKIYECVIYQ